MTERKIIWQKGHDHKCKGGLGSGWKGPVQESKKADDLMNRHNKNELINKCQAKDSNKAEIKMACNQSFSHCHRLSSSPLSYFC